MQTELTNPGVLLNPNGSLANVGWSRQPLLDCNLEKAHFYTFRPFQHFRIKRWDYYAFFTPGHFYSATIADLGYAGNIFAYTMDLSSGDLHEEGLVIPFSKGIFLPRNSTEGTTVFENKQASLRFNVVSGSRHVSVSWPGFHDGRGLSMDLSLACPPEYESMNIVIPIGKKRFYYNRKINCMPASGTVRYGSFSETLDPHTCLGSLDWGRGVWEYSSFWNWASASGFLPDGRRVGLNLGCGFGDLSKAGENSLIVENRIHKFGKVSFDYVSGDYMEPWKFKDEEGNLDLVFTPFRDRTARTDLKIITSEVHQMFGHYNGTAVMEDGKKVKIKDLIGFAEEHQAKW